MDTETPVDFAVDTDRDGPAWVVAPAGEIDMSNVDEVRAAIAARPEACDVLVLDFAALTFLDTSGLRLVVEAMQETHADGVRLALVRGTEDVQRLFVLARLETRLPFFDDVRAAVDQP
jgi:anti-sigma B factor antagonist